jgi:hypothetical protein
MLNKWTKEIILKFYLGFSLSLSLSKIYALLMVLVITIHGYMEHHVCTSPENMPKTNIDHS